MTHLPHVAGLMPSLRVHVRRSAWYRLGEKIGIHRIDQYFIPSSVLM
jgi:hypothetical protein